MLIDENPNMRLSTAVNAAKSIQSLKNVPPSSPPLNMSLLQ